MTTYNIIDWKRIPDKQSKQKQALKKAIFQAGSSNNLAKLINCNKASVSHWIHKKLMHRNKNLMCTLFAGRIEKVTKIKGIQYDLCPEIIKPK